MATNFQIEKISDALCECGQPAKLKVTVGSKTAKLCRQHTLELANKILESLQ